MLKILLAREDDDGRLLFQLLIQLRTRPMMIITMMRRGKMVNMVETLGNRMISFLMYNSTRIAMMDTPVFMMRRIPQRSHESNLDVHILI